MVGIITSHSGLRPDAKRYVMAGRGVVVDKGGRGDFTTFQDACDYMAARTEGGHIWVREGHYYENVAINAQDIVIEGASWDAIIDGQAETDETVDLTATSARVTIQNLQMKSTAGGGGSSNSTLQIVSDSCQILNCYISESDGNGIYATDNNFGIIMFNTILNSDLDGIRTQTNRSIVIGNIVSGIGRYGIYLANLADDSICVGNIVEGGSVIIQVNGDDMVVVGNRLDGAVSDSSGNSTVASNDTTAF